MLTAKRTYRAANATSASVTAEIWFSELGESRRMHSKEAWQCGSKNEGVGEHVRTEISPDRLPRQTAGKLRGHPPQRTKSS
jgi:hypothetical protein